MLCVLILFNLGNSLFLGSSLSFAHITEVKQTLPDSKQESTELQKEIESDILSGESDGVDYVYNNYGRP